MKCFKWLALLLVAGSTACFSPIYDTAMTHEGFTVGGGVAYQKVIEIQWWGGSTTRIAFIRPEINVNYGFTNWFSVVGRAGCLILIDTVGYLIPCAGLGIKLSTPGTHVFNLALRAEADYPNTFALTPMMGIATNKGHEFLTAGVQVTGCIALGTLGFFINMHPFKGAHILVGSDFSPFYLGDLGLAPGFYAGIGYTYNFGKKRSEEVKDTLD